MSLIEHENTRSQDGAGMRILLVEDDFDSACVMSKLLERFGHTVRMALNIDSARRLIAEEKFDIMVSDLTLPDGDGYDLMREVRGRSGLKGIAISGYGADEDLRKSREAGFSDHVLKPVSVEFLDVTIRQIADGSAERWR